ncbi:ATP-grasp domain-containing protein [Microvirga sp. M2]|uniref:ATP-grasp domain-containing protein n=1 Tax=Microvirga sp. M2 TaxID=3073270 RepID=UPI0039C265DC
MAFLRALTVFDSVAWMNHPRETYQAETKPFQLAVAQRVGFTVPSTLVSNDASAIQELFPSDVMIKPLDTVLIREGDETLFAYANAARADSLDNRATPQSPLIAQDLKTGKVDWRVTVIGDEIYPVRILKDSRGIEGDWRRTPKADLRYEDGDLPPAVASSCKHLLREVGLSFGGIDLIETADGFSFVEVNPTGEFGWLVEPHRPLDQVIARWLACGGAFGE